MPETTILIGDVRERLRELPDDSIHCVVTSPPYFGQRDFSISPWVGGDPACTHGRNRRANVPQTMNGRLDWETAAADAAERGLTMPVLHNRYPGGGLSLGGGRYRCAHCGAEKVDPQVGLEASPQEYVESLTEISREIRRVLRPDGLYWLVIGDTYGTIGGPWGRIKQKDLIGVPWMCAFALRDDGWYLRSETIWNKVLAMPESGHDRPTQAHEHIFMFSKISRDYSFDGYAVQQAVDQNLTDFTAHPDKLGNGVVWNNANKSGMRNIRSVWTLGPERAPEFHYAVFVSELPRRCILASLGLKGVCQNCGVPWRRNRKSGGWYQGCACRTLETGPGTVLDPFLGSGTTAMVAMQLGHNAIGIELNPTYAADAKRRIEGDGRFFKRRVKVVLPPDDPTAGSARVLPFPAR